LGILTRTNSAQVVEARLGKIAERTGQPYRVQDFQGRDLRQYALDELARHSLPDTETVIDPVSGREIPNILTGNRFFMKLHHLAESKDQGRSIGGYTAEGLPTRGGVEGSKRLALMDVNALLSHGATSVLRDTAVRGQAHPEFWASFMSGHRPAPPDVPLTYKKFLDQLQAAGIHVQRDGPRLHVMALTNDDVDRLTEGRTLDHAETVDWQSMEPVPGGLFDPQKTGGHGGKKWASLPLAEPMVNPVMEEPARRLLRLTENQFRNVLAGHQELGGQAGPEAIRSALDRIDVPRAIEQTRQEFQTRRGSGRDAAARRMRYLEAADRLQLHPRNWVLDKVPVLPPLFRPVSTIGTDRTPLVADPNYLYQALHEANQNLSAMKGQVATPADERLAVYDALKAVTGLGDPTSKEHQDRGVRGILKHIFGASPKHGVVQSKLLSGPVDLVGRAVIVPDPDIDMDGLGIPEERAWEVYKPFVVRRLVRRGMDRLQALRSATDRRPEAKQAMLDEMDERPVVMTRAPVLHRYGTMAFRPQLRKGDVIHVSPFVIKGYGADFDGDAVSWHVPFSDEAAQEALTKMLPSRNLLSVAQFDVHQLPINEMAGGLYSATTKQHAGPIRHYPTRAAAIAAFHRGELSAADRVVVQAP